MEKKKLSILNLGYKYRNGLINRGTKRWSVIAPSGGNYLINIDVTRHGTNGMGTICKADGSYKPIKTINNGSYRKCLKIIKEMEGIK